MFKQGMRDSRKQKKSFKSLIIHQRLRNIDAARCGIWTRSRGCIDDLESSHKPEQHLRRLQNIFMLFRFRGTIDVNVRTAFFLGNTLELLSCLSWSDDTMMSFGLAFMPLPFHLCVCIWEEKNPTNVYKFEIHETTTQNCEMFSKLTCKFH